MKRMVIRALFGAVLSVFTALGAWAEAITSQDDFAAALSAATDGATITLGEGSFTLDDGTMTIGAEGVTITKLNFVGAGAGTTLAIGNSKGDGNGGVGSCVSATMTFKDLALTSISSATYTGFTQAAGLTFTDVTFNYGFSNWGNKGGDVVFDSCTFNQTDSSKYCVQELRSASGTNFKFVNCTFNSNGGRFINAYKQGGSTSSINIVVEGCTFNNTGSASKAAINVKDGSDGCTVSLTFIGTNTTSGSFPTTTPSVLFQTAGAGNATVYLKDTETSDPVTIYANNVKTDNYVEPNNYTPVTASPVAQLEAADGTVIASYTSLQEAFNAAVASTTDNVTLKLLSDVTLTEWTSVEYKGYGAALENLTIDGDGHTITGLTNPLFSNTYAAKSLTVKNLTIDAANIAVADNDANGAGAILAYVNATETVTLSKVTVKNSKIGNAHWSGALIGASAGYSKASDGPVFTTIKLEDCSVTGNTVTGACAGSLIGHATQDLWTRIEVSGTTVTGNTVTGESDAKTGVLFGRVGIGSTDSTNSKNGGVFITSATVSDNTSTKGTSRLFGSIGQSNGLIEISGGTYSDIVMPASLDNNGTFAISGGTFSADPTAYVVTGYAANANDGSTSWTVAVAPSYIAQITRNGVTTQYTTLAAALIAAQSGDTIEILAGTWGADAVGTLDAAGTYTNANAVRSKSLTIQPVTDADGNFATVTFTSQVYLGYDDSSTCHASMTVKNLNFDGCSLVLSNYLTVDVENCTFVNGTSSTSGVLIVQDSCCKLSGKDTDQTALDYTTGGVTIKNCSIDGSNDGASGIRLRNSGNVTIEGCTIANSKFNGILLESNTSVVNTSAKNISITGNTITEWNATNTAEKGRAMRINLGSGNTLAEGSTVTITGNVMTKSTTGYDSPDFIKVTGLGAVAVDLDGNAWNYWSTTTVNAGGVYSIDTTANAQTVGTVINSLKDYVAEVSLYDGTTKVYVTTKYTTLADALAAVTASANSAKPNLITLLADIDLNNEEWTPINLDYLHGSSAAKTEYTTFDGNGHTVKNLKITGNKKNVGFFGTTQNCTVQNLTIDGASVVGINHVAALVADACCGNMYNCTVKNAVVTANVYNNDDGDKAGAICGYLSAESTAEVVNCTVENCTITGYRDIGGVVGYANGPATVTGNTVKNTTVVCDLLANDNYKSYTTDAAHDVNQIIGETSSSATVSNNTADNTDVKVVFLKPVATVTTTAGAVTRYETLAGALTAAKTGDTVTLLVDVDLNNAAWTPVAFASGATFDGAGHTISNLKVTGTGSLGLFASTSGGTIKDFTIDGATIGTVADTTGSYVGVVVGQAGVSTITGITVKHAAIASNAKYVGGITGSSSSTITRCQVLGTADAQVTITGKDQVGGVVGYQWCNGVDNCTVSYCSVTASEERAGCLIGKLECSEDNDSYFSVNGNTVSHSSATAPDYAGGLMAQIMGDMANYEIKNNTIDATLTAGATSPIGVLRASQPAAFTDVLAANVTGNSWTFDTYNVWPNEWTWTSATYTYAGTTAQAVENKTPVTYTYVAKIGTTKYETFAAAVAAYEALPEADQASTVITVLNYNAETMTAPTGYGFATDDTNVTTLGRANFYQDADGVYHIRNLAGMKEFRDRANTGSLNGTNSSTGHTKVVLDADIDLGNEEWTPIVMSCVDFDGQNHTIKNLKVTTEAKNVGLFGTASISTVKNLTVDTATVTGINHVAVIAGDGLCGHFINCTVKNATVTTSVKDNDDGDKAGAICGYLSGESDAEVTNCTVENCTVTGYRDIGGAVGYANGTASVTGNTVKNTTVVCDLINNAEYKNYTTDAAHDANKIIGETSSNATVSANTVTNVKVVFLKPTKFTFSITGYDKTTSPETPVKVGAEVYPDYSFKVALPTAGYDQLGADKATVDITMTDVASLGVSGTRSYTKTVETGVTGVSVSLSAFLENTYAFEGTTVPVTITDKTGTEDVSKTFNYSIAAITDDQIVGTPSSEADARAAWQLLTSQVTAAQTTEDDTHFLFKKDSYLQIGNERLTFTKDFDFLKGGLSVETLFDDVAAAVAISSTDADGKAWATGADTYKATLYLPAGSTLAVSQSAAALKSDMTLVVDASKAYTEGKELTGVLSGMKTQLDKLEGSNKTKAAILALVMMFDEVVGLVDAADNVPVTVTFEKSKLFVLPETADLVADITLPRTWVDQQYPGMTDAQVIEVLKNPVENGNGLPVWQNLILGVDGSDAKSLNARFAKAASTKNAAGAYQTKVCFKLATGTIPTYTGVTVECQLYSGTDAANLAKDTSVPVAATPAFDIVMPTQKTYYTIKVTIKKAE